MSSSVNESITAAVHDVRITGEALSVSFTDGRTLSVPLRSYPRLADGSRGERTRWRLIAGGTGIHWPALDEDISVAGLLAGLPSGESQKSLRAWLAARRRSAAKPTSRIRRQPAKNRIARATRG
jgi:hypothetical protein